MSHLAASELILNNDGSIYHLNLLPENIADTIITVGDPERVEKVTKYFDTIDLRVRRREFHTQTGTYKGKKITVISTGIGTDNIDIVMNELDALVNIDFRTRSIKKRHTSLDIVRIGTSGSIQPDIPVDSFLVSKLAVGFDALLHFYDSEEVQVKDFNLALDQHLEMSESKSKPYVVACSEELAKRFSLSGIFEGITGTNVGFYGPQGRILRLGLQDPELRERIGSFSHKGQKITNLEMETAGIYGLAKLLGHRAVSLNAIIANRATGEFSSQADKTVDELVKFALDRLVIRESDLTEN